MSTLAVVQARMTSTRLPGKVLRMLGPAEVLSWVVDRLACSELLDGVVVATSDDPSDDPIEQWCSSRGHAVFRGSLDDVLDRYRGAAADTTTSVVVRVTADCPLVDPGLVDDAIRYRAAGGFDYVSTSFDGRYPRGLDVEVMTREALEVAAAEAREPEEREHVTLFIYRRPDRFACDALHAPGWAQRPNLRLTLDEPADDLLLQELVSRLGQAPVEFDVKRAIALLDKDDALASLNAHVRHRFVT